MKVFFDDIAFNLIKTSNSYKVFESTLSQSIGLHDEYTTIVDALQRTLVWHVFTKPKS